MQATTTSVLAHLPLLVTHYLFEVALRAHVVRGTNSKRFTPALTLGGVFYTQSSPANCHRCQQDSKLKIKSKEHFKTTMLDLIFLF